MGVQVMTGELALHRACEWVLDANLGGDFLIRPIGLSKGTFFFLPGYDDRILTWNRKRLVLVRHDRSSPNTGEPKHVTTHMADTSVVLAPCSRSGELMYTTYCGGASLLFRGTYKRSYKYETSVNGNGTIKDNENSKR